MAKRTKYSASERDAAFQRLVDRAKLDRSSARVEKERKGTEMAKAKKAEVITTIEFTDDSETASIYTGNKEWQRHIEHKLGIAATAKDSEGRSYEIDKALIVLPGVATKKSKRTRVSTKVWTDEERVAIRKRMLWGQAKKAAEADPKNKALAKAAAAAEKEYLEAKKLADAAAAKVAKETPKVEAPAKPKGKPGRPKKVTEPEPEEEDEEEEELEEDEEELEEDEDEEEELEEDDEDEDEEDEEEEEEEPAPKKGGKKAAPAPKGKAPAKAKAGKSKK
jgi:hypothetical protein